MIDPTTYLANTNSFQNNYKCPKCGNLVIGLTNGKTIEYNCDNCGYTEYDKINR